MIEVLKGTYLFKGIDGETIAKILLSEKFSTHKYEKGEIIANQGEKCTSLSIVLKGEAVIQTIYENGKVLTLANFKTGDIFAEALLFSEDYEYPATVMCIEECEILSLPKSSIIKIIQQNSLFMENILSLLSQKIVLLNRKIKLVEMDSIRKKICKVLLDNYKKTNNLTYKLKSKKDLAEEIGVPRPSLSRELICMRECGLVDVSLKEIRIISIAKLEDEIFS